MPQPFPVMTGRDLTGRQHTLPADLPDAEGIVLFAFKRHHQAEATRWATLLHTHSLPVVEVPYISSGYRPIASFVHWGMRGGIVDSEMRARTVTVYGDPGGLARSLGCGTHRPIAAAHRAGEIVAVAQEDPSPEAAARLAAALG